MPLCVAVTQDVAPAPSVCRYWLEDPCVAGRVIVHASAIPDAGRWTVNAAVEEAVAAPVITAALFTRFRSRIAHSFGEKLLSAMRNEFGGHVEPGAGNGK